MCLRILAQRQRINQNNFREVVSTQLPVISKEFSCSKSRFYSGIEEIAPIVECRGSLTISVDIFAVINYSNRDSIAVGRYEENMQCYLLYL